MPKLQDEVKDVFDKAKEEITDADNLSNAGLAAKKELAKRKWSAIKEIGFKLGEKLKKIIDDISLTIEEKEAEQEKVNKIAEDAFSQIKKLSVENNTELNSVLENLQKLEDEAKKAIDEYQVTPVQKPESIKISMPKVILS